MVWPVLPLILTVLIMEVHVVASVTLVIPVIIFVAAHGVAGITRNENCSISP